CPVLLRPRGRVGNRAPQSPRRARVRPTPCKSASRCPVRRRRVGDQNPPGPACNACCPWVREEPGILPAPGGARNSALRPPSDATEDEKQAKLPIQTSPSC